MCCKDRHPVFCVDHPWVPLQKKDYSGTELSDSHTPASSHSQTHTVAPSTTPHQNPIEINRQRLTFFQCVNEINPPSFSDSCVWFRLVAAISEANRLNVKGTESESKWIIHKYMWSSSKRNHIGYLLSLDTSFIRVNNLSVQAICTQRTDLLSAAVAKMHLLWIWCI